MVRILFNSRNLGCGKIKSTYLVKLSSGLTNINFINHDLILNWQNQVLERASANGWNNYLQYMRALFQFGVKRSFIQRNPFIYLNKIDSCKELPRFITDKILMKLKKYCHSISYGWFWLVLIDILYFTGIKRKQLITLVWQDIDLDKNVITLYNKIYKVKREYDVPMVKNLKRSLIMMRENIIRCGHSVNATDKVFNICLLNKRFTSKQMTEVHVDQFFHPMTKKIGISVSAKMFRHTMAINMINSGKNIEVLQNVLGYSNLHMTMNYLNWLKKTKS